MPDDLNAPSPLVARIYRYLIRGRVAERLPPIRKQTSGYSQFLHYFSDAVAFGPSQQMLALEEVYQAAVQRETTGDEGVIDLFIGDPAFGNFTAEEMAALAPADARYPPWFGLDELRQLVATAMAREDGVTYKAQDEVVITAGASQAINAAVQCFCNPGDKVVLFDPSYLFYYYSLRMQRAHIAWVPTALTDDGIDVDWAALERALRRARMLFINSPCNPTGGLFSPAALHRIVEMAARHDVLIVSDEVYNRFVYQGRFQATALCPKAFERTITIRSLSKEYGMAGFRVGWMAAPEGLMRPLKMHHVVASIYVPNICQQLALRVLSAPDRDARRVLPEYRRRREIVARELKSLGFDVTPPQGAFYFWFRIPPQFDNAMDFVMRLLEEERVLLMPGNYFGPSGRFYVRLSLSAPTENLSRAMSRIAAFMGRIRAGAMTQEKR